MMMHRAVSFSEGCRGSRTAGQGGPQNYLPIPKDRTGRHFAHVPCGFGIGGGLGGGLAALRRGA